jgi:hypothetical protein
MNISQYRSSSPRPQNSDLEPTAESFIEVIIAFQYSPYFSSASPSSHTFIPCTLIQHLIHQQSTTPKTLHPIP